MMSSSEREIAALEVIAKLGLWEEESLMTDGFVYFHLEWMEQWV